VKRKKRQSSKLDWSRLYVPPTLSDLFFMIAKKHGYDHANAHRFLLHMLKLLYPDEVSRLADYFGTDLDSDPPEGSTPSQD
jgi:hypothetical protein